MHSCLRTQLVLTILIDSKYQVGRLAQAGSCLLMYLRNSLTLFGKWGQLFNSYKSNGVISNIQYIYFIVRKDLLLRKWAPAPLTSSAGTYRAAGADACWKQTGLTSAA